MNTVFIIIGLIVLAIIIFDDSKPYDFPHSTFSRISSTLDKISPDEEAKWVHENISMRR